MAPNIVTAKIAETEIFIAFAPALASLKKIGVFTLQASVRLARPSVHAGGIRDIDIAERTYLTSPALARALVVYSGVDHGPAVCVMKLP